MHNAMHMIVDVSETVTAVGQISTKEARHVGCASNFKVDFKNHESTLTCFVCTLQAVGWWEHSILTRLMVLCASAWWYLGFKRKFVMRS